MREKQVELTAKMAGERLKKNELFHTSGYAQAQNESTIGASGRWMDTAKRAVIEAQRKFVQNYQHARLMQNASRIERARRREVDAGKVGSASGLNARVYGAVPEGRGKMGEKTKYAQTRQSFKQEKVVRPSDKFRKSPRK